MGFDAVSEKNDNFIANGKFDFELLEKQDHASNLDQISGYRRVTTLTSGKSYLITQTYHDQATDRDVRFILYPGNSIPTQSKLYQDVETPGVRLIAIGSEGDTTDFKIGDKTYHLTITAACDHKGFGRYIDGAVAVTCETDGFSGNVYCSHCNEMVEEGKKIPKGHDVVTWEIKTQPTFEADGEEQGTCTRCGQTATRTFTKEAFAEQELRAIVMEARALAEAEGRQQQKRCRKPLSQQRTQVKDITRAPQVMPQKPCTGRNGADCQKHPVLFPGRTA
jgi:hypothetical protein